MSLNDIPVDLMIHYGMQLLGAVVILGIGFFLARSAGNMTQKWLQRQDMEPPVRTLLVRMVRILVMAFTLIAALDKFGVQVAPLIAGIGVMGLGLGIAMQGVLSNVMAGLSIIFTKPYRVGEYIELVGVYGQVATIDIFSTTLIPAGLLRVVIPNPQIVGGISTKFAATRQLNLTVGVGYVCDHSQC